MDNRNETSQNLDEDYRLWLMFVSAHDLMVRYREVELNDIGVTFPQYRVLQILSINEEPLNQADIARQLFREPHSVSSILNRMEEAELIVRKQDPERKNRHLILLTKKGKDIYEKGQKKDFPLRLFGVLSKEEKEKMQKFLFYLCEASVEKLNNNSRPYKELAYWKW